MARYMTGIFAVDDGLIYRGSFDCWTNVAEGAQVCAEKSAVHACWHVVDSW